MKIVIAPLLLACATAAPAGELTVHAAASLTDVLRERAAAYEQATGTRVVFNFGASSVLARQIVAGAPGDLFLSADEETMDAVERAGLLLPGTRRSVLSNTLVVVVPEDNTVRVTCASDLAGLGLRRLALAEPRSVPAGIYAKAWLEKTGVWAKLADRVVPTENVRGALAAAESGNVGAAIVYKTDAAIAKHVKVAFEVPRADGPAISYPFAVLRGAAVPEAAKEFLAFLESEASRAAFRRFGFLVVG